MQDLVRDLNRLYAAQSALWELDDRPEGFSWIDANDAPQSVFSWIRWNKGDGPSTPAGERGVGEHVVMIANLTPLPRHGYRVGLPRRCDYVELLNTDATAYGGSGVGNLGRIRVEDTPSHGRAQSALVELPPLGVLWLTPSLREDTEPSPASPAPAGTPAGTAGAPPAAGGGAT